MLVRNEIIRLNILSIINVVLTCYSNALTSGSPVANPKSGPDYSEFITK
jgi:hypothetical protein